METTRTCKTCSEDKPLSDFPINGKSRGGHLPHCKRCYTIKNAFIRYGIENIFDYVDGRNCEICKKPVSMGRHNFAIDHDHRCCGPTRACAKCLRGVLCNDCNHGIGKLGDSIGRLESAIAYLKKYGTVY